MSDTQRPVPESHNPFIWTPPEDSSGSGTNPAQQPSQGYTLASGMQPPAAPPAPPTPADPYMSGLPPVPPPPAAPVPPAPPVSPVIIPSSVPTPPAGSVPPPAPVPPTAQMPPAGSVPPVSGYTQSSPFVTQPTSVPWGMPQTAAVNNQGFFMDRVAGGRFSDKRFWIMSMKVIAWVLVVLFFILGILSYFVTSAMTADLNYYARPNVALSLLSMLLTWIGGFVSVVGIMVFVNMADDINRLRSQGESPATR